MKKYKGSMTVEVSMIFPVVLFSIVAVIMLAFYLNDVVSTRAIACEYGIISNTSGMSEEEISEEIHNKLIHTSIISDVDSISVNKMDDKTEIEAEISMRYEVFDIHKKTKIKVNMHNENNRDYITKAKVVIDILNTEK